MYRILLLSIFLVIIVFKPVFIKNSKEGFHTYLYSGSTNLRQHIISKTSSKPKLVFLGNSSVAGSNIPQMNNISEQLNEYLKNYHSYNLGVLGASTTALLTLLELSLPHNPKALVIGINPGLLANNESGPLEWNNLELIRPFLSPTHFQKIMNQKASKNIFTIFEQKKHRVAYPPNELIELKSYIFKLKSKIYGPTMSTDIYGKKGTQVTDIDTNGKQSFEVLKTIIARARENNIQVITYFDPIYKSESTFDQNNFKKFKKKIREELAPFDVILLDYTDKLKSNSSNFLDYIHLNPMGNKNISKVLARDLKGLGID